MSSRAFDFFSPANFGYPINYLVDNPYISSTMSRFNDNNIVHSYSDDIKLYYSVDVPGMTKHDIKITINNWIMKIVGERKDEHREMSISKSFCLSKQIDVDSVVAIVDNGVLTISFEKIKLINSTNEKIVTIS
tara:strand:+ start:6187 stop:6585 length:399 start_codon:yes stop_codon:yes gene_type:complete